MLAAFKSIEHFEFAAYVFAGLGRSFDGDALSSIGVNRFENVA